MSPSIKAFVYAVIVADLLAIVVFAGRFILTGSVLAEAKEQVIVVASVQNEVPAEAHADASAPAAPAFDYASYVADAAKGAGIAGKCKACHTFDNGGPNRVGPNLFGIVGRQAATHDGFTYSDAMKAHGAWDEPALFAFLENPRAVVAGTKMAFGGIKNPAERADLIAYLKTLK